MTIAPGAKLGPYEILSQIGAGGMGQVWKARDTRIDRIVAIKTSHDRFTDRFAQEVRAIAALNHPHICTLYDVGPDYLVMEYVEGSEIKGPLPLDQTLKNAIQLASALEAAHRKGITHRDLKPANILVTKAGIKVLDFGLAKFEQSKAAVANDETLTRALTQEGSIVGTLQYMAPEQLQGKATDARADFFSFGCVLYEMLTGKRAFDGSNTASLIVAIMEREPPSMGAVAPASLDWLVRRCLAKDPDERWQTARDLRAALERIAVIAAESEGMRRKSRLPAVPWIVAAALGIAAAAVISFIHFREKPFEMRATRFSIAPQKGLLATFATPPAVSPDGSQVVFMATSEGKAQLWLRPFDSLNAQPVAGTEAGRFPFWSPDGKSIGFFAGGKLKKLEIGNSAAPTVLADASNPRGGTWNQYGVIVFAPGPATGLMQVSDAGGAVRLVTRLEPNKNIVRFPRFLPDGKHFLYLASHSSGQARIRIGSLAGTGRDVEVPGVVDSFAEFAQGRLLYVRGSTLMARPFDPERLTLAGEAVPAAESITPGQYTEDSLFSVSTNGVLVYQGGTRNVALTWLDRSGKHVGTLGEPGAIYGAPTIAPGGRSAAAMLRDAGNNVDVWLFDMLRGVRSRFTFDPALDASPLWSPDARTIVFRSTRSGTGDLYRKPSDGSRNEELLYSDGLQKTPESFSSDGRYLAYWGQGDAKTGSDIWILPDPLGPPGASKPYTFLQTDFNEQWPQFSPDGRWMAYQSDESGNNEIYVAPFPGPGGKRRVSVAGGASPKWRSDGKELFYFAPDSRIMAAEVSAKGDAFEVSQVTPLFALIGAETNNGGAFDVTADGQRFLAPLPPEGDVPEPLTVVQNWMAGLKK